MTVWEEPVIMNVADATVSVVEDDEPPLDLVPAERNDDRYAADEDLRHRSVGRDRIVVKFLQRIGRPAADVPFGLAAHAPLPFRPVLRVV